MRGSYLTLAFIWYLTCVWADSLPIAPLLPLDEEFPLLISSENRTWMEGKEAEAIARDEMANLIDAHAFPWTTLAVLIGVAAIGWVLFLTRVHWQWRWEAFIEENIKRPYLLRQMLVHFEKLKGRYAALPEGIQPLYELAALVRRRLFLELGQRALALTADELASIAELQGEKGRRTLALLKAIEGAKYAGRKIAKEEGEQLFAAAKEVFRYIVPSSNVYRTCFKNRYIA